MSDSREKEAENPRKELTEMSREATLKQARVKYALFLAATLGRENGCLMGFVSCKTAVFAAYDLYAIQYLLKPVDRKAVRKLLDKAGKIFVKNTDREKMRRYSWRRASGTIPYGKILYISSSKHVLTICCTDDRVQESTGKLSDLERQICGDTYLRCHQSFIVNTYHVRELSGTELVLAADGQKVPVSRRYYAEVKKRYRRMLFEEVKG